MPRRVTKAHNGSGSVTWRYIGGTAIGLLVIVGGSWQAYMQTQVSGVYVAVDKTKEKLAEQSTNQAVTNQKVQDIDRKVDEVRTDVGTIKSTLQQILINQQQQIREAPPPRR